MTDTILTKADLADRFLISKKTIDKACSQASYSLPPFFKVGGGKNSPIRFRLSEVLKWEGEQLEKQRLINEERAKEAETSLESLLSLHN